MKRTCWDTRATDSIIKSGQKDTEASITHIAHLPIMTTVSVVRYKLFLFYHQNLASKQKAFWMRAITVIILLHPFGYLSPPLKNFLYSPFLFVMFSSCSFSFFNLIIATSVILKSFHSQPSYDEGQNLKHIFNFISKFPYFAL